ncbi:MAG: hypothetical protein ACLU9S_07475 [Oscillospiraceae bacterium]
MPTEERAKQESIDLKSRVVVTVDDIAKSVDIGDGQPVDQTQQLHHQLEAKMVKTPDPKFDSECLSDALIVPPYDRPDP